MMEKCQLNLLTVCFLKCRYGEIKSKTGVSVLIEAALLLEPEKTMTALGEMQMTQLADEIKKGGM